MNRVDWMDRGSWKSGEKEKNENMNKNSHLEGSVLLPSWLSSLLQCVSSVDHDLSS